MSLLFLHPFFGRLAMRLDLVEDKRIDTAATNGESLFYSADFVTALSKEEREFLIAHEVMHCALLHPYRRGDKEMKKANVAMDYAINPILIEAGMTMPKLGLIDSKYDGMSWEHIYTLLPNVSKSPSFGDVIDANESAAQDQEWQVATEAAIQEAMEHGNCPKSLQRNVAESRKKKVNWRELLWHLVEKIRGTDDYSFSKPSYKSAISGCYLPSMYSEETLPMAVVIDTSGSIDSEILSDFLSEIRAIADILSPKTLHVCCADADVQSVEKLIPGDDLTVSLKGGGGTDFRPAISWAESLETKPAIVIYFTDLEGSFPSNEPSVNVLWVSTTNLKAPFGETIYIN